MLLGIKHFVCFGGVAFLRGYIEKDGERFDLPPHLKLYKAAGYTWPQLVKPLTLESSPASAETTLVLNGDTFTKFFVQYEVDATTNSLYTREGIIEAHAGRELKVYLVGGLNEDAWAQLLDQCIVHQVRLTCYCTPGVVLPKALLAQMATFHPPEHAAVLPWPEAVPSAATLVIQSTDTDVTAHQVMTALKRPNTVRIDVTECEPSDLLHFIDGKFNAESLTFQFVEREQALLVALKEKKDVILTGRFSPELANAMACFLFKRYQTPQQDASLIIISEETSAFQFAMTYQHKVSVKEKQAYLQNRYPRLSPAELPPVSDNTAVAEVCARIRYRQAFANSQDDKAWEGVRELKGAPPLLLFNQQQAAEDAEKFNAQRLANVNAVLTHSPFVLLTGLTGVGKSTFVEKVLATQAGTTVYSGDNEAHYEKWLQDKTANRKILFLDEANLTYRLWSEFEGLFNQPPSIVYRGNLYLLTEQHKVVFAGNPLNYGGGRKLPALFERHGNAVLFTPLSLAFIYEKTLKPLFRGTALEGEASAISERLLDVYAYLCHLSTNEVLISPRELEMMALMIISHHAASPSSHHDLAITRAIEAVAGGLVPKEKREEFNKRFITFKPASQVPRLIEESKADYVITASREAPLQVLRDLLTLREYRQAHHEQLSDGQRYGGLGGFIVSGDIGSGRKRLVLHALLKCGYQEVRLTDNDKEKWFAKNIFFQLPASLSDEVERETLLNLFDRGAVVIIERLTPRMERLLNGLLMGKKPDGERPMQPGFTLIVLRRPTKPMSQALLRRMVNVSLPAYQKQELVQLLTSRGLTEKLAEELLAVYDERRAEAVNKSYSPQPTLKDLLEVADEVKELQGRFLELKPEEERERKREIEREWEKEKEKKEKEGKHVEKEKVDLSKKQVSTVPVLGDQWPEKTQDILKRANDRGIKKNSTEAFQFIREELARYSGEDINERISSLTNINLKSSFLSRTLSFIRHPRAHHSQAIRELLSKHKTFDRDNLKNFLRDLKSKIPENGIKNHGDLHAILVAVKELTDIDFYQPPARQFRR